MIVALSFAAYPIPKGEPMADHPALLRVLARELYENRLVNGLTAISELERGMLLGAADRLEDVERRLAQFEKPERLSVPDALDRLERGNVGALRYFLVSWEDNWGPMPAPGSFVFCGHAAATWRVHAFDRAAVGGWLIALEPIDPHDVPVLARVPEVPLPVADVTSLPADHPQRQTATPIARDALRTLGIDPDASPFAVPDSGGKS